MSAPKKHNPGGDVLAIGVIIALIMLMGGVAQSQATAPPSLALGIMIMAVIGLTIFIASVVGAYYSGKGKR